MIDVLIVGAGIGGLTLARALAAAGVSARIVERAPAVAGAGAGLLLAGNARACLAELGLFAPLEPRGRWILDMAITDAAGAPLGGLGAPDPADSAALFGVHRAALHDVLRAGAADTPVTCGATVTALDPGPDHVRATLDDGEVVAARLVVGCDGVGSQIRKLAFGAPDRRYAGYTCWRIVVPAPGLARGAEMWGRGQRVGLVPLGDSRVYAFLVADAPAGTWSEPTSPDDLRARFSAFGGDAPAVLAAVTDATEILHHDIEDVPEHRYATGRVGLLGDAAHALTPNMGQGAAMAIEDAVVLGRCVRDAGPTPEALACYATARAPRVRAIARRSWRIGQLGQWSNPAACALRTAMLRLTPARVGADQVRALVAAGPSAG